MVTPNIEIENIDKVEKYYSTKVFRLTFLARIRLQGGVQEYFKGFFFVCLFFCFVLFACLFLFLFLFYVLPYLFIYFFRWWIKLNLLCFNGKVLKIYVSRDQIPVLRTGSRPIAMVLVECWKVAHWTAKKLLTNCHLDFLICSYHDNQKLYFSFFTINANIGREKG